VSTDFLALHLFCFNIRQHGRQILYFKLDVDGRCFYLELTLPQENVLLNLLAQKYGLQYQMILNFEPPLPLNGNLKTPPTCKKFPIMNFSNISLVQNKILCILVFCNSVNFLCIFTFFVFSVCTFYAFRHESTHFVFFCFALLFFCTSLISFCNFFTFLLFIF